MKITDLTRLKQRNDETVAGFVQRFREVRNKCYSLNLGDKQLAELAFQGLLPTLREKYASHDFESLSQLFVSQVQTVALVSDLSESLNESNYCFIVPLLEPSQISDLHLMDAREEVVMELLFQIRPLDDRVSWQ